MGHICNTFLVVVISSSVQCSVMWHGQVTSVEETCEVIGAGVYITWDLLATTITA